MATGWEPPDGRRVPISVHPDARDALNQLLRHDTRYQGVSYSEFLMAAVAYANNQPGPLWAGGIIPIPDLEE
jgi:hypothetical protein